MTSFVDIEGSGIFTTHIIGQGSNQYSVIKLQDDSELRLMTVKNTSPEPAFPVRAITVAGTTGVMTQVRAIAEGATGQAFVALSGFAATVRDSILIGGNYSLSKVGSVNVITSELDGPIFGDGVARCVGAYDEHYFVLGADCLPEFD